jgi:hypothetical protein
MLKWFVALILSATFAAPAFSQSVVMFGEIAIGQPLTLAPCPPGYEVSVHPLCYTGAGRSKVFIEFPHSQAPTYIGSVPPVLQLKDGRVVGMDIYTNGVIGQESVYSDLLEKFGPPLRKTISSVKTIAGASHKSIYASWAVGDVTITLNGTLSTVTSGAVSISLPEAREVRESNVPKSLTM